MRQEPPALPSGYQAQPAWGFHDRTGRFSYEFNRVYGRPNRLDQRGPTCRLDEGLSYWGVTWPTFTQTGDERPAGRWMTYAEARKLRGSHLTFERFSSLQMRDELPELLHVGNVGLEPVSATLGAPGLSWSRDRPADPDKQEPSALAPRFVPVP